MKLRPFSLGKLAPGLQSGWDATKKQAQLLAHISCGRPGYAISLIENPNQLSQRDIWIDEHINLILSNRVERFSYVDSRSKDKAQTRNILLVWLSLWRDVLLKANGARVPLVNIDRVKDIENLATHHGSMIALEMVEAIGNTLNILEKNINVRLAFEVFILDLPISKSLTKATRM